MADRSIPARWAPLVPLIERPSGPPEHTNAEIRAALEDLLEWAQRAHDAFDDIAKWSLDSHSRATARKAVEYPPGPSVPPGTEPICQCGHHRSDHVMGKHYCMRGCYTTAAQADSLQSEMGARPTCERYTPAEG